MGLAISRRNTPSSFSAIPDDLTINILSRLTAKSIARCRCVSKQWASILRLPDFTERFLSKSSTRPRLLFTFQIYGMWKFFSSPQTLNPDQNSCLLSVDYHMCLPGDCYFEISPPVHGLICTKGRNWMICNPSTGQYITLPRARSDTQVKKTYFGYDPIRKQFKVLCVSVKAEKHQILTLETGLLSWRTVDCSIPHYPVCVGICINGVLYYKARKNKYLEDQMIVCFDVRSENFTFITDKAEEIWLYTLINYKGKLGALATDSSCIFDGRTTSIKLWVLDDAEEHKWSSQIFILPPLWRNVVADAWICIVGMTSNGEIVLSSPIVSDPFCIFYYNVESNTIVRVEIQGMRLVKGQNIGTYINHLEDVKLL